ncbi:uncharacterized protein LOC112268540 [Brachypodium distachyon]|uniref:uncharacterized protein LOC112268540 n=1 Tax=Brachypodium distachyon TaxID=15368 RepID=UPI000D0D2978|nr:uncharacterized protein LOC112268540 [Brachypodium distachyon]XP_024316809.1 uncharacterized protein LOC112268540 [Brachypodium distachyon]XP_024316810.1 uncharacterized protein LOC112268540 [Brachypodium distachyon]XP_024316811.1 uncharacterized protein LOC112268540 [Brachypodium distachyon]XP_024316812.1 uncharacterized protein LOC112268540 [Brachypodium distachyon]XP_024316813.1 uncharacterized protein LOC112268540 [Brachypodium distachyon]|eukprot:XP_024316808.1 uncharacterized protein LOC112268540 [Brachypodium distachyon]
MGKKKRQQQKRTNENVTGGQQPKEAAVPAKRATNKNVTGQQQPNDPAPQGHTAKNKNNNEEEVPGTSTQRKPTDPNLEVTEAPKEEVCPLTLSTTNPFSEFSFGATTKAAPKNETPPPIFGIPYFVPQTTTPEPLEFSFGATATVEKKNSNQGKEDTVEKSPTAGHPTRSSMGRAPGAQEKPPASSIRG